MILNEGITNTCEKIAADVAVEKLQEILKEEEDGDVRDDEDRVALDRWVYRGEGNANLVLALPRERKVVRLRKSSPGEASSDGGLARTTREVQFLEYVISGHLGDFVQPPETLRVNRDDVFNVAEALRPLRPEYRQSKEIVEEYATRFPDYTFLPEKLTAALDRPRGPTFCVEIKPKQGFRYELDEQFEKCTYCLTQYHKLKNKAVRSRSSYCPLDLFSGEPERMKKSLRGLLESPQNNLKIFRDGVVVCDANSRLDDVETLFAQWFGSSGSLTTEEHFEAFFKLVSGALLREFSPVEQKIKGNCPTMEISSLDLKPRARIEQEIVARAKKILRSTGDKCNFERSQLPPGSVLGRILRMQQLPYHSADTVFKIYSKHLAKLNDDTVYSQMIRMHRRGDERRKKVSVRNGKVDLAASKVANGFLAVSTPRCKLSDSNGNENNKAVENGRYSLETDPVLDLRNNNNRARGGEEGSTITAQELEALQNYLIVTTARDCSILMAFQEIDSTNLHRVPAQSIVEANDRLKFVVNIGVLDLDPKNIHCVEKHRERDTNVLVSLINSIENNPDSRTEPPFRLA